MNKKGFTHHLKTLIFFQLFLAIALLLSALFSATHGAPAPPKIKRPGLAAGLALAGGVPAAVAAAAAIGLSRG